MGAQVVTPRSAAERGPRTAAGRTLPTGWDSEASYLRGEGRRALIDKYGGAAVEEIAAAIEAEARAGTEDDPMHTDEEYIEYGAHQYRRGRAQAEYEAKATAAVPLDVERLRRIAATPPSRLLQADNTWFGELTDGVFVDDYREFAAWLVHLASADGEGTT